MQCNDYVMSMYLWRILECDIVSYVLCNDGESSNGIQRGKPNLKCVSFQSVGKARIFVVGIEGLLENPSPDTNVASTSQANASHREENLLQYWGTLRE